MDGSITCAYIISVKVTVQLIPYMSLLLEATTFALGNMFACLQHGRPHHVYITVKVVQ